MPAGSNFKVDKPNCFGLMEWAVVRHSAAHLFPLHTAVAGCELGRRGGGVKFKGEEGVCCVCVWRAGRWKHHKLSYVKQERIDSMPKDRRAEPRAQPGSGDGGRRSSASAQPSSNSRQDCRGRERVPSNTCSSFAREREGCEPPLQGGLKDHASADDLRHTVHVARPCSTGWCVQGVRFLTQVSLPRRPTECMTSPCDAWLSERMFCTPTKNFLVAARRVAHVSSNKCSMPGCSNSPLRTSWQKDTHWMLVYISTQHALFMLSAKSQRS